MGLVCTLTPRNSAPTGPRHSFYPGTRMRLLCPYCQKPITVADSEAGKTVNCPECREQFAAPQLFTPPPTPYEAPGRPGWAPSPPPMPETHREAPERPEPMESRDLPELPTPDRELSGYRKIRSVPMKPEVIRWIPPAAMTLVFLLTLFPWDGLFPGGNSAYTQNAWQCLFGSVSYDPVAERLMGFQSKLEERVHSNLWLLPYLFLLVPALVLAWAGPIVEVAKIKIPPNIEPYWKYRSAALAALLFFMFLLLLLQCATGFGIQRGVEQYIDDQFTLEKASAKTPEEIQTLEMKMDGIRGSMRVRTTTALRLAIFFHLIAALAALGELGLALRGDKSPPRVAAMW